MHQPVTATDTCIMLNGGTLFDILDPAGSAFTIADIAHGLGQVARFAGQANRFYSVAEHCVHVARLVPVELRRAALLHDASEAFIGDVTRPLKALLPDYRAIEQRVEDAICERFLPEGAAAMRHPLVKAADLAMCAAEAEHLMPFAPGYWNIPTDPETLRRARNITLNYDRPEYATAAWKRAWDKAGHMMDRVQTEGLAE